MKTLKLGIVSSSNGGALSAFFSILQSAKQPFSTHVITDRECGIENALQKYANKVERIPERDNNRFSALAAASFEKSDVDLVLTFFTRLITSEIFTRWTTVNIHESLLPAFTGFSAIDRAHKERVRFFGSTMHLVDKSIDGGRILAQAACPVSAADNLESLSRIAFIQKTYFLLLIQEANLAGIELSNRDKFLEHFSSLRAIAPGFSPSLSDPLLIESIEKLDERNNSDLMRRVGKNGRH